VAVNIYGDEWDESVGRDRPGWQWKRLPVGRLLGAEQIGASLYELAPGQKTYPYHWQVLEEEWLIVIRGEPTLRDPSGERKLAPGDCAVFKRGPEGAHLVRNDTGEPVRILMLSANNIFSPAHGRLLATPKAFSSAISSRFTSSGSQRRQAR